MLEFYFILWSRILLTLRVTAAWMLELTSKAVVLMSVSLMSEILKEPVPFFRSSCHW